VFYSTVHPYLFVEFHKKWGRKIKQENCGWVTHLKGKKQRTVPCLYPQIPLGWMESTVGE